MKEKINKHAKALSKLGAAKGGNARASTLTPEQRKEISQKAIKTRWSKAKGIPIEQVGQVSRSPEKMQAQIAPIDMTPISLFQGELEIGSVKFSCHVLDNGKRVIVTREIVRALTGTIGGNLKGYLTTTNIKEYLDIEKIAEESVVFKIPGTQYEATGYEANLLVDICDAYLKARESNKLTNKQKLLAKQAEIIMRACAKVGIIALIDEATGYQKIRAENALRLKLQAFITDELQEWVRMFPEDFFVQLARLENVHYSPRNRPIRWGKYVLAFVYAAVDKDVARALKERILNPHKGQNLHQLLKDYGKEKVIAQIYQVLGIMKTCKTMDEFKQQFDYIFKKVPLQSTFFDLVDTLNTH